MMLASCSVLPHGREIDVVAEIPAVHHPKHPGELVLQEPKFEDCGKRVCLTRNEAKKVIENDVEVGRWAGEMNRNYHFYRDLLPEAQAE
jgi:hypothetical protein